MEVDIPPAREIDLDCVPLPCAAWESGPHLTTPLVCSNTESRPTVATTRWRLVTFNTAALRENISLFCTSTPHNFIIAQYLRYSTLLHSRSLLAISKHVDKK